MRPAGSSIPLDRGSLRRGVLTGSLLLNDEFGVFSASSELYTAVPFLGAAAPDVVNPGRYTIAPLDIPAITGSPAPFDRPLSGQRRLAILDGRRRRWAFSGKPTAEIVVGWPICKEKADGKYARV